MLFFVYESQGQERERTWHVNEPKPKLPEDTEVIAVQADGHELEWVQRRFQNLPNTTGAVVIWKGEFARFIWDNFGG